MLSLKKAGKPGKFAGNGAHETQVKQERRYAELPLAASTKYVKRVEYETVGTVKHYSDRPPK